ncbi:SRPBCC family protein [bacterium LRH843]|nr:SRPBCC family protein [bacterium LRH843]
MIANIQKSGNDFIAKFERYMDHSVEDVWAMLTENEKLTQWFSELKVDELRKGGIIKFDMQDGTFEEMTILNLELYSVLEFTWANDIVRFELTPEQDGCLLVLNETLKVITNHTPKDLAGWHVCLDVIKDILDGRIIEFRKERWEKWFEEYVKAIAKISNNQ